MNVIDLNCDMGVSFGRYNLGDDAALMPWISSVNIACGFHAGDPLVMQSTIALAQQHNLAIGAHPSYPDLQGFGRRAMAMNPDELEAMLLYQIGALAGFLHSSGGELTHVKPHGALYNQAAREPALAAAVARGVLRFSHSLILVGLAGSALIRAGLEAGLQVAAEGFVERGYMPDGSLIPRGRPGAIIEDPAQAATQAIQLATKGICAEVDGQVVTWRVDTLCIHGDSAHALNIAQAVRYALEDAGIHIRRLGGL